MKKIILILIALGALKVAAQEIPDYVLQSTPIKEEIMGALIESVPRDHKLNCTNRLMFDSNWGILVNYYLHMRGSLYVSQNIEKPLIYMSFKETVLHEAWITTDETKTKVTNVVLQRTTPTIKKVNKGTIDNPNFQDEFQYSIWKSECEVGW